MEETEKYAAQQLSSLFNLEQSETISFEKIKIALSEKISQLIQIDFQHFIFVLYRLDIDEKKIEQLIADHPREDPAPYIADLIIDRQFQKAHSRAAYRAKSTDDNDDDNNERKTSILKISCNSYSSMP